MLLPWFQVRGPDDHPTEELWTPARRRREIDLEEIIRETCAATGRLDHDMIIAQATKNLSPQALVSQCVEEYPETITRHLFENHEETLRELIEDCEPEEILREVIDGILTEEDRLIYVSGLSPAAAKAFMQMQEADVQESRTEYALIRVIRRAIMAACRAVWDKTHMTDQKAAARP